MFAVVRTFTPQPPQDDWLGDLNPESLLVIKGAYATPDLAAAKPGDRCAVGVESARCALHCAHVRLDLQQMCGSTAAGFRRDCCNHASASICAVSFCGLPICLQAPAGAGGPLLSASAMLPPNDSTLIAVSLLRCCCAGSSWSGWATSAWIPSRRPGPWCSTAPARSRCAALTCTPADFWRMGTGWNASSLHAIGLSARGGLDLHCLHLMLEACRWR